MKCFYVDDLKGESPLYSKVLKASLTGGLTVVCSLSQFALAGECESEYLHKHYTKTILTFVLLQQITAYLML